MNYVFVDSSQAMQGLDRIERSQVPYAIAVALTRTALAVREAERDEIQRVFDRPTPYTVNAPYAKSATKATLTSEVGLKNWTAKGTPASKYLAPEILGGERSFKRSELALMAKGAMSLGYSAVAREAQDVYGNITRGQIQRILTSLQIDRSGTQNAKRKGRTARGAQYFVAPPGGRLPAGVWARTSTGIKPILFFERTATYRQRYDFYGVALRVAQENFPEFFRQTLDQASSAERLGAALTSEIL